MSGPAADTAPDVTVVTVAWQAADLTLDCLASLAAQDLGDVRMHVVVVDNASTDGTAEQVALAWPDVEVVRAPRNLGFAGGNALALPRVASRYVVLLNNDAVARPDAIRRLVEEMDGAPEDVAAMAATVLLADRFRAAGPQDADVVVGPDGRWVLDPGGPVRLVNSTGNEVRTDGYGQDRGWLARADRLRVPADVFGFSGAAAILRTAALREVGFFDERFFMYYEDTDLSWRLRLAGHRVRHCPGAVVEHVHSASSSEGSRLVRFHDLRNRLATLTKNATAGLALRVLVREVLTTASLGLRRRRTDLAATRVRALASWVALLPHLLRERRRIGRGARVGRDEVERLLVAPTPGFGYRA